MFNHEVDKECGNRNLVFVFDIILGVYNRGQGIKWIT
jgi:hypothetical protein